jgi:phosphohistidine phosphatase
MKIYFLRHGIAGDRESWSGSDFDRPLTDEGRVRMDREAKSIAKLDLNIEAIVSSPLVRAKETAEIVAARLKLKRDPLVDERLGPEFDLVRLAAILSEQAELPAIMLVGHDPSMTEVLGELTGARLDLKKGGLACVEATNAQEGSGTLLWLATPKLLTL